MPMDGLLIGFSQREVKNALEGGRITRVTQPQSKTLVLHMRNQGKNFKLLICTNPNFPKFQITNQNFSNPPEAPMFCMLMRKHLQSGIITNIEQVEGDRYIKIIVSKQDELKDYVEKKIYVELMGRNANLIITDNEERIIESFRHVSSSMSRVREIFPGKKYIPPPMQNKLNPLNATKEEINQKLLNLRKSINKDFSDVFTGFSVVSGKDIYKKILKETIGENPEKNITEISRLLEVFFKNLERIKAPEIIFDQNGNIIDITPFPYEIYEGMNKKTYPTIGEALDEYYSKKDLAQQLGQKTSVLAKLIKTQIRRSERKLELQQDILRESENMDIYRIYGEIITANIHQIIPGSSLAILENFYDPQGAMVKINLDKLLTPSENAQKYFKKYQKAKIAQKAASEQIVIAKKELIFLENTYEDLHKSSSYTDLEDIQELLEQTGYIKHSKRSKKSFKKRPSKPLKYESSEGISILVGKNALQNEHMLKNAHGDEIWLHVKGIPGSHVIIKSTEKISENTLIQAAQLAVFYSNGRREIKVPVDYTKRKHVRKQKGAPIGFVTYSKEKTLQISVKDEDIRNMKTVDI